MTILGKAKITSKFKNSIQEQLRN